MSSVQTEDIKYMNLVQLDIEKFNETQEQKRKAFAKEHGMEKYYETVYYGTKLILSKLIVHVIIS